MASRLSADDGNPPVGRLQSQLSDPKIRQGIVEAEVIRGFDVRDEKNFALFYGRKLLERIAKKGKGKAVRVVNVPIDFATNDVEALAAACVALKGSCCYDPDDPHVNPGVN